MGLVIDRDKRLSEINAEIIRMKKFMELNPDPSVQNRLHALSNNPCLSGNFYLNAIWKENQSEVSEQAAIKYRTTEKIQTYSYDDHLQSYFVFPKFFSKDIIERAFFWISRIKQL